MKNIFFKYAVCSSLILISFKICAEQPQGRQMKTDQPDSDGPISCIITHSVLRSNVWVDVTFSNTTSVAVAVWERNLLKETALTWVAFDVHLNGETVEYFGKEVKRLAPAPSEFYKLKPGEVYKASVDLSRYYDLSKAGTYQVKYFAINPPESGGNLFVIKSPQIAIELNPARHP